MIKKKLQNTEHPPVVQGKRFRPFLRVFGPWFALLWICVRTQIIAAASRYPDHNEALGYSGSVICLIFRYCMYF